MVFYLASSNTLLIRNFLFGFVAAMPSLCGAQPFPRQSLLGDLDALHNQTACHANDAPVFGSIQ